MFNRIGSFLFIGRFVHIAYVCKDNINIYNKTLDSAILIC